MAWTEEARRAAAAARKAKAKGKTTAPHPAAMSGVAYKGRMLTNREYKDLLAKAKTEGREVVHRTELGRQRKPGRRWETIGTDKQGRKVQVSGSVKGRKR